MPDTYQKLNSLRATADHDPYEYYAQLRDEGGVVWDDDLKCWLVTSYQACKEMMRNDTVFFTNLDFQDEVAIKIAGGRQLKLLKGEEHHRAHLWHLRFLSPRLAVEWRPTKIQPLVNMLIDRFAARGYAELASELADEVPIRAIAALAGLPWRDDSWIDRARKEMATLSEFFSNQVNRTDDLNRRAIAASQALNEMLRPFIEQRRDGTGSDSISMMWREGPGVLEDWGFDDVVVSTRQLFFNGSATTAFAIMNALYLLLTYPTLVDEIRAGGDKALANFIEESLRLHGVSQFRPRIATEDTGVAGVPIGKGEKAAAIFASANRDPNKYECPHLIDLNRPAPRDHLAFSFGPRVCVGAGFARATIHETLSIILQRMPDMRLDPDREAPAFRGFMTRSHQPLHVRFTPIPTSNITEIT